MAWFGHYERHSPTLQTTDLEHQIDVYEKLLHYLSDAPEEHNECERWLKQARDCLSNDPFNYAQYDEAWGALYETRHIYCRTLPAAQLEGFPDQVAPDLDYVSDETKKRQHKMKLRDLQEQLHDFVKLDVEDSKKLLRLQSELAGLSLIGAIARQPLWHRVNLLRHRLMITAILLAVVVAALTLVLWLRPALLGVETSTDAPFYEFHDYPNRVLGIVGFGVLGGLLSALRQQEPLRGTSSAFYMERTLLWLRPIVGAAAALALYFAQLSELVAIGTNRSSGTYFFVAFCAGFSEQFFLKHLTAVLQREKKTKRSGAADE